MNRENELFRDAIILTRRQKMQFELLILKYQQQASELPVARQYAFLIQMLFRLEFK